MGLANRGGKGAGGEDSLIKQDNLAWLITKSAEQVKRRARLIEIREWRGTLATNFRQLSRRRSFSTLVLPTSFSRLAMRTSFTRPWASSGSNQNTLSVPAPLSVIRTVLPSALFKAWTTILILDEISVCKNLPLASTERSSSFPESVTSALISAPDPPGLTSSARQPFIFR